MKAFISIFTALLFNSLTGVVFAGVTGIAPMPAVFAANAAACLMQLVPQGLRAGVLTEIWTGELVKSLRGKLDGTWLDGIPDASSVVNNDVIHLVEVGVDPDVLVNNTTYPIATQKLDDKDISISLDKFQTKVTPITDDELYAISYDKMSRVKESHSNAINDAKFAKAAHALCPTENTDTTPVLVTTGERDADIRLQRSVFPAHGILCDVCRALSARQRQLALYCGCFAGLSYGGGAREPFADEVQFGELG